MRTRASVLCVSLPLTLALLAVSANCNEKRPVLPVTISNARTIYVENQTAGAELYNTAYTELLKWGRFRIVDKTQKPDLILRLSSGNSVKFVEGDSSKPAPATQPTKESLAGADQAVPPGSTRISIVDAKTGNSLWSEVRKTNNPKAASHMLDGFREAFDRSSR